MIWRPGCRGPPSALHEGVIDAYKAQLLAEATRVLDDAAAAAAEAAIFGAGIDGKTPGQLRAAAGRAVLQADPAAARKRREEAQKDARVELWREDAGTAALCGFGLPPDAALAADQRIRERTADLKAAGVPGTMDQLRVRAYLDALLGQDTAATTRAAAAAAAASQPAARAGAGAPDARAPRRPGPRLRCRGGPECPRPSGAPRSRTCRARDGQRPRGRDEQARGGTAGWPGAGGAGGDGGADQPDHPAGHPAGAGGAAREAAGFGPIDADLARAMAANAAAHPATTWCLTVTDRRGTPPRTAAPAPPGPPSTPRRPGLGGGPPGPPPRPGAPPQAAPADSPGTGPPGHRTRPPPQPGDPAPAHPAQPPGTGRERIQTRAHRNSGNGRNGQDRVAYSEYGTWRLRPAPGGPDLSIDLEPIPVTGCDHRHPTRAHDPGDPLRHLIHIRDGECTWPPCRRNGLRARRCDFEHAIPWEPAAHLRVQRRGPLSPPPSRQTSPRLEPAPGPPARLPHVDHPRRAPLHTTGPTTHPT